MTRVIESFWDPLRVYQFRIALLRPPPPNSGTAQDVYVAGVQKVSGLNMSVNVSEVWEGGNSLHRYANPDRATWDPITLEQGLALNDTLERWARSVHDFLQTGAAPSHPVKRNVAIDVWEPSLHREGEPSAGQTAETQTGQQVDPNIMGGGRDRIRRFLIYNAWISRYQALPALDAMSNEVALLSVELVHDGWRMARTDEMPPGMIRTGRS
jgi:phage tail-like protein